MTEQELEMKKKIDRLMEKINQALLNPNPPETIRIEPIVDTEEQKEGDNE
jgi:hypothetical protein